MQAQRLETTDIFKSAVFLCNGGRLAGMRFTQRNQGIVSFLIEGEGILGKGDVVDKFYKYPIAAPAWSPPAPTAALVTGMVIGVRSALDSFAIKSMIDGGQRRLISSLTAVSFLPLFLLQELIGLDPGLFEDGP
jgi:hypothetical protein